MNRSRVLAFVRAGVLGWLLRWSLVAPAAIAGPPHTPLFRAGASVVDITPTNFPVIVNAMFEERTATNAVDRLHARCLALDDGTERILIAVVDSCMLPRDLIDETKRLVNRSTGLAIDRMLVSATHTHSAPSAMGCLGSRVDAGYAGFLPGRIAEGMSQAIRNLAPARIGWGVIDDFEHTHCRRWIRRPDRLLTDPFGDRNVRANMHPGYQSPDAIGPSGPVDPALTVLSVQTPEGRPVALLANYSMHYYESPLLSADYYGLFATKIAKLIGAEDGNGPFVGMMSQGTSGDQMWMDYGAPRKQIGLEAYAQEVAEVAAAACRQIQYRSWVPLAMRESKVTLNFRVPDETRLTWARGMTAQMGDRLPRGMAEIYAKEAIYLHERPRAELVLQALRIGDLGMAAIPNEVYAISGLKIKAQSPFPLTCNIELANGSEGYIPPPEQHRLGGYTTWPARTAGLETNAEPRIVEESLRLLEQVAGKPRRPVVDFDGAYAEAVLSEKPEGYWRMNEFNGPESLDTAQSEPHTATYEGNVAFYLEGPPARSFSRGQTNRAPHFAGGFWQARRPLPADDFTIELWFWNGLPADARALTGQLLDLGSGGGRLFLDGTNGTPGRLLWTAEVPQGRAMTGATSIAPQTWHHLAFVRQAGHVTVYLDGEPEMVADVPGGAANQAGKWSAAGSASGKFNFEGKVDEIALYSRALSQQTISRHVHLAQDDSTASPRTLSAPRVRDAGGTGLSSQPKAPLDALATLRVPEGFAVELVAAEPMIASPVAIDWGTDGKLWVVEMADYPYGMDGKMRPGGRVRVLEDVDGDGRMDKATLFLDGLNFPNGIITWGKGAIITAAPDIFYAEDTDGDGKADRREVLFTGFGEGNLQLRVNGLRWGLDNWLHCANGWSGGRPRSLLTDTQIDINGRDLRLEPTHGWIEAESGQSEFGRNPDDWGNWFGCDNSYPLFHFVLEDRLVRRNPHVAAPDAKRQLYLPPNPRVYPLSQEQKRYHSFEHASHFTSACSTDFYRDEWLFPRGADEHAFVCEPVHNLVQHLVLNDDGVSFQVRRAESEGTPDFLASPDQWFRPVMARTGPDGALWIVDMYRYMIEHPDWLPEEGKKELAPFYRAGENRGRIYRVVRQGSSAGTRRPIPRLDHLPPTELVTSLAHPNGWVRDKAQQRLLWAQDRSVRDSLENMAWHSPISRARLHALSTLEGLNALRPTVLEEAFRDGAPGVRRLAVQFAETRSRSVPELLPALASLADDPDARVRLQVACTLGESDSAQAGAALIRLALRTVEDASLTAAVMSSAPRHLATLVEGITQVEGPASEQLTFPLLQTALGSDRPDLVARLLERVLNPGPRPFTAFQFRTFASFLDTLSRRNSSLAELQSKARDGFARQIPASTPLFQAARQVAPDPDQPSELRAAAASLLGRSDSADDDFAMLADLLDSRTPGLVQRAALRSLARTGQPQVPDVLLKNWASHVPETRAAIVDELLGREPWALDLLQRIERSEVMPIDIPVIARDRMKKHRSEQVRASANRLLTVATDNNRQAVIEQFRPALTLAGDARRGQEAFARICAVCHRLDNVGHDIGPNLISVRGHPPEKLMTSILDPSREVEPRYLAYTCALSNGEELYGLIGSETGNSVEMKLADGTSRAILRSEIQSLHGSKVSLMPDGLESGLSPQDLADLIHYLRFGNTTGSVSTGK